MPDIKEIFGLMQSPSEEDKEFIARAYAFAQEAHKGQRRIATDEPYFNHLFETAKTLAELGMGPITIAAGLLHDSIEDVGVTADAIREQFGNEVAFLVEGVTKLGKLHYSGTERYTENLRRLFIAISKDVRVLLIKLADRRNNVKTLKVLPLEKRKRIALETLEIYAPLAYRIGIRKLNRELEDLSFPHVLPDEHERVLDLLKKKQRENLAHLEKFHKAVKRELAREGIVNIRTGYRIKGLYSLYRKLVRKDWDIEKIYDISALRIVVPTVDDCYKVLGVIHCVWRPLPGRIKDYIALPKPDSYRGIHTTIFTGDGGIIEVQIRTAEMHRRTEYGMHFEYKETLRGNRLGALGKIEWVKQIIPSFILGDPSARKGAREPREAPPSWLKELGEYQATIKEIGEYVEVLKTDFFGDRVFIFTPKGDVIDLPAGSTGVDFAYAIHSEVGNHMAGVKVNGKMVTFDTPLSTSDIVEIQTKQSARPSNKWLEFAKTALAKKQIRTALDGHGGEPRSHERPKLKEA